MQKSLHGKLLYIICGACKTKRDILNDEMSNPGDCAVERRGSWSSDLFEPPGSMTFTASDVGILLLSPSFLYPWCVSVLPT
jgi:hypothetical protein